MALSVVVAVGDKTADELCARLEKKIASLRVGPGLNQTPENEMGPLISSAHRSKVLGYIDSGEAQGANLRVDGRGLRVKAARTSSPAAARVGAMFSIYGHGCRRRRGLAVIPSKI